MHTVHIKYTKSVHRYAQYAQSWSVGLFFRIQPTIEHTMCVLDTLCMNFVHTFNTVCTLCVNSCVPARTVCKRVSSKHNVCMKCTFIVRGSHRRHKAHTKCTRGVRSFQEVCTMGDMHATYPFCRSVVRGIQTPPSGS